MTFKQGDTITTIDIHDESCPFNGFVVSTRKLKLESEKQIVGLFFIRKKSTIDIAKIWTVRAAEKLITTKMVLIEKTIIWEY